MATTQDTGAEPLAQVEALLGEIESLPDPAARDTATALVQALLELYGEGLARIVPLLGEDGRRAATDDELVSHLLLLHDVHPVPLAERVEEALEGVRPYLDSHGGGVQLVGVEDGIVRLRLKGSCEGCPSSTMTLKLAIEDAIRKVAPDVVDIEAEGVSGSAPAPGPTKLLQIEVSDAVHAPEPAAEWLVAGTLAELSGGGTLVKAVAGEPVLFVRVMDDFYGYRPDCPGCARSMEGAVLRGSELACGGCGHTFDVRRAGRCLDAPGLFLEPLPLLQDDAGIVKVARGAVPA
ncbi:MAG TPA: NifU family protein [Thermoleophilaceae bacterium]|nr:NifU family protein [Thermoleophilaceae bacterium]